MKQITLERCVPSRFQLALALVALGLLVFTFAWVASADDTGSTETDTTAEETTDAATEQDADQPPPDQAEVDVHANLEEQLERIVDESVQEVLEKLQGAGVDMDQDMDVILSGQHPVSMATGRSYAFRGVIETSSGGNVVVQNQPALVSGLGRLLGLIQGKSPFRIVPSTDQDDDLTKIPLKSMLDGLDHPPEMNMETTSEAYIYTFEAPHVKDGEIAVDIDDNVMTVRIPSRVKVEKQTSDDNKAGTVTRRTVVCKTVAGGSTQRTTLATDADTDALVTKFENGVLTITIPRKQAQETEDEAPPAE